MDPELAAGEPAAPGLTIRLTAASGEGPTRLAAFDSALVAAGVADFNLIRLSSIIPPGSTVVHAQPQGRARGTHGDRLYCVYAAAYTSTAGESAWAGLSWALRTDSSGAGLLVEHGGWSRNAVERDLRHTLTSMIASRPEAYEVAGRLLSTAECRGHPVCALVIAAYAREPW